MRYVDGFVLPIPKKNLKAYLRMARRREKIVARSTARSTTGNASATTSSRSGAAVPAIVKSKPGETVVFSYIVYKSRAHRDRVNAKVMKDNAQHGWPEGYAVRHKAHGLRRVQSPGRRLTTACSGRAAARRR